MAGSLIFAVQPLTTGFAQSGRLENHSAIYRYSNSVWAGRALIGILLYIVFRIFNWHLYRAGRILMPRLTQSPNVSSKPFSSMRKAIITSIALLILVVTGYNYFPDVPLPEYKSIDSIAVFKSKRELLVFSRGNLLKTYKIALGGNPNGHKQFEGDKRTPEGLYFIYDKNPKSGFHKNLGISYPNQKDIEAATKLGKPPGGEVKIHGLKNGIGAIGKLHRMRDWTNGCIALTNSEIDEIFVHVKIGTPISIFP